MQYELQFFHQLIYENFQVQNIEECIEYLKSKYEQPLLVSLAKVKIEKERYNLLSLNNFYFLAAEELKRTIKFSFSENYDQTLYGWLQNESKFHIEKLHLNLNDKEFDVLIEHNLTYEELTSDEIIYHYYDLKVNDEYDKILYNFQRQVFNSKDPNEIKLYLNNHQHDIVKLLRLLLNKIDTNQKKSIYRISDRFDHQDLIKNSFQYLEKIAHFLFISFSNYIDKNVPVPFFFLTSKVIVWKSILEEIISLCTGKINQDLLGVVSDKTEASQTWSSD